MFELLKKLFGVSKPLELEENLPDWDALNESTGVSDRISSPQSSNQITSSVKDQQPHPVAPSAAWQLTQVMTQTSFAAAQPGDKCDTTSQNELAAALETSNQLQEANAKWKQQRETSESAASSEETKKRNPLEEYFKGDLEGVVLTDEFLQSFDRMETTSDNLIITGKAGTGKSTLLKYFLVHTQKSVAALAPTGIAAINIGGDTIHKFFQFPPHILSSDDIKIRPNNLYSNIDTLIIDEFSMVNANVLDAVDEMMRANGKTPFEPFGGAQVIFFGDFFQLPPVVGNSAERAFFANEYDGNPWFFNSKVFHRPDFRFQFIELHENHRQNEQQFMSLLDNMRLGRQTPAQLDLLNSRFGADTHDVSAYPIMLVSTNRQSNEYNAYKLDQLDSEEYTFEGKIEGTFPKDRFPTLPLLHLKVGAQVMTLVNNRNSGYANGTIGRIVSIQDDMIRIEADFREGRRTCDVYRHTWENFSYHYDRGEHRVIREKVGTFTQFPLKLAWSITVHKSQGLTFDAVTLDIGGNAFAPGMAYVAVSRCRRLDGLCLYSRIRQTDVKVDYNAWKFYLDHS